MKATILKFLLGLTALSSPLLVGCVETKYAWERQGGTGRQFQQDLALCRNNAGVGQLLAMPPARGLSDALMNAAEYEASLNSLNACMETMGYRRRAVGTQIAW